jgi:ComF family protein
MWDGALLHGTRALLKRAVDAVLPSRCLGCGEELAAAGGLCAPCWSTLAFIGPPWCRICGRPLPHTAVSDPVCLKCQDEPPPFDRARSALRYDARSSRLVLGFKRGARFEGVEAFSRWLARAAADLLPETDLILPVPLHRSRLLTRGFNQSAVLAKALAKVVDKPWSPSVLLRHRATRSQQGLQAHERAANITERSFRVRPRRVPAVDGKRVLLVDDVLTTGATLAACTAVLRRAGAATVDVVTLTRVVRDETPSI